mmetsp:Transcript_12399/g.23516  ORF Transcript_12399/g.23516 Transcript_12399/m.23516 type:complete len:234 (+) Transcript_12399:616-1317(+)
MAGIRSRPRGVGGPGTHFSRRSVVVPCTAGAESAGSDGERVLARSLRPRLRCGADVAGEGAGGARVSASEPRGRQQSMCVRGRARAQPAGVALAPAPVRGAPELPPPPDARPAGPDGGGAASDPKRRDRQRRAGRCARWARGGEERVPLFAGEAQLDAPAGAAIGLARVSSPGRSFHLHSAPSPGLGRSSEVRHCTVSGVGVLQTDSWCAACARLPLLPSCLVRCHERIQDAQ